ncbi:MAG TPA: hypothetical protein VK788_05840 [Terriglobales bacterium]|jgi:hypothetical protein|nr:hypothetical protein [Terriglobales bacterium]
MSILKKVLPVQIDEIDPMRPTIQVPFLELPNSVLVKFVGLGPI